ncbi:MAG: AAA family ATPase [Alphaproteobacteria bacterium]|nr:AAA family ATPase [Alphaproteobacteria bacterium]
MTTAPALDTASTAPAEQFPVALVPRINIGIFCDNPQSAQVMQAASADRRMAKAHVNVQMGGIPGATQYYGQEPTPHVVVVESHGDRAKVMAELGQFAEVCGPNTKVIVVGHVNDILLYRELMKNHVSDYIVAPFTSMQIIESVASIYNDPKAAPLGRVMAFVGAKGGVGSSTIAHNVAFATSQKLDVETILTDLDLSFGTAALNFNQDGGGTFYEALMAPDRVDATLLDRLMSKLGNKLSLLNGPGSVDREMNIEAHSVETVLNVVRQAAPMIIVDVPNMWAPWVKYTLMNADEIVITATPELPSLRNAKNLIDLLKVGRPNDRQPRLVLNQVGVPKRPEIPPADFAKALGLEPSAIIPHDPQSFGLAQGNGQMIFEVAPKSKAAELLLGLSEQLVGVVKHAPKAQKFDLAGIMQKLPLLKKKEG